MLRLSNLLACMPPVQVMGANHSEGMLHIELKREVPEVLKPRQISISRGSSISSKAKDRVIEALAR